MHTPQEYPTNMLIVSGHLRITNPLVGSYASFQYPLSQVLLISNSRYSDSILRTVALRSSRPSSDLTQISPYKFNELEY